MNTKLTKYQEVEYRAQTNLNYSKMFAVNTRKLFKQWQATSDMLEKVIFYSYNRNIRYIFEQPRINYFDSEIEITSKRNIKRITNLKYVHNIISNIIHIRGLTRVCWLGEFYRSAIKKLENNNNIGVRDCLEKEIILVVVHNSEFRDPPGHLVLRNKNETVFPSLPFEELNKYGAISSSPSKKVHWFLNKALKLNLDDEDSTLIIGLNLN